MSVDAVFEAIAHAFAGGPLARGEDLDALVRADDFGIAELCERARAVRAEVTGRVVTYSPKVFLPVTNLCRNRCDYCSFRRSPGDAGEWTMSPDEVRSVLDQGAAQGCFEALLCLGDTPETGFGAYRTTLRSYGHDRTVDYLAWVCEQALERGLLPHTNAGILAREDMARLRPLNISLGLMLESVSERLCEKGMPHHKAPDKRPRKRVAMTLEAGELAIPFTSGLLIGIGETRRERVETLLAIAAIDAQHGHVGEVIVQNFRARPGIVMEDSPEPAPLEMAWTLAVARLLLPPHVRVQAPPNLNEDALSMLLDAGLDDFGGISPVTPDFINPRHPWPHLERLGDRLAALGFSLVPRLAAHPRHLDEPRFVDAAMRAPLAAARARLDTRLREVAA